MATNRCWVAEASQICFFSFRAQPIKVSLFIDNNKPIREHTRSTIEYYLARCVVRRVIWIEKWQCSKRNRKKDRQKWNEVKLFNEPFPFFFPRFCVCVRVCVHFFVLTWPFCTVFSFGRKIHYYWLLFRLPPEMYSRFNLLQMFLRLLLFHFLVIIFAHTCTLSLSCPFLLTISVFYWIGECIRISEFSLC